MLIVHIVNEDGGVGNVVVNLANSQIVDNKVVVATTNGKQRFIKKLDKEVEVITFKKVNLPPMICGANVNKIYNFFKKKYPNENIILHAHNIATIGLLARVSKLPLICTIHGLSTFPNAKRTFRVFLQEKAIGIIIKRIKNGLGIVVGVSNHTSKYYENISNKKIDTIYNGYKRLHSNVLTNNSNEFNFIHVGDISSKKGWELELKAFSILRKKYPKSNLKFTFAGRICGYTESDISNLISENDLNSEQVKYLGIVDDPEKEIFSFASALLLISESEGLPMCIVEAFSMGIPVIASPVGGIPEIVSNGKNGFIVDREVDKIVEKMELLMNNKAIYKKCCSNGLDTFKKDFDYSIMIKKYQKEYERIAK